MTMVHGTLRVACISGMDPASRMDDSRLAIAALDINHGRCHVNGSHANRPGRRRQNANSRQRQSDVEAEPHVARAGRAGGESKGDGG